jgi:selT/selW/selH-like putative selenoprotein
MREAPGPDEMAPGCAQQRFARYSRGMKFQILYCKPCGYRERAEELAAELRARFGAPVDVEEGGFGQFDVLLDGELVASKGGRWKRMLIHGAPPQARILAAIDRALADREGDFCAIPETRIRNGGH